MSSVLFLLLCCPRTVDSNVPLRERLEIPEVLVIHDAAPIGKAAPIPRMEVIPYVLLPVIPTVSELFPDPRWGRKVRPSRGH